MIINWGNTGQYKTYTDNGFFTGNDIVDWGFFPVGSPAAPPPVIGGFVQRRTLVECGTRINSRKVV